MDSVLGASFVIVKTDQRADSLPKNSRIKVVLIKDWYGMLISLARSLIRINIKSGIRIEIEREVGFKLGKLTG